MRNICDKCGRKFETGEDALMVGTVRLGKTYSFDRSGPEVKVNRIEVSKFHLVCKECQGAGHNE